MVEGSNNGLHNVLVAEVLRHEMLVMDNAMNRKEIWNLVSVLKRPIKPVFLPTIAGAPSVAIAASFWRGTSHLSNVGIKANLMSTSRVVSLRASMSNSSSLTVSSH